MHGWEAPRGFVYGVSVLTVWYKDKSEGTVSRPYLLSSSDGTHLFHRDSWPLRIDGQRLAMMDASTIANGLFARASGSTECYSDRASDYYGLGVRLGIYFAWVNAYLAHILLPSGIGSAAGANTVFLLTLFIAMGKDSMRGHLTQVDGLVLMHLCGGATFGVLSIWGYRTRLYKDKGPKAVGFFGSYGTHIRVAISFAISAYGLWYWSYGVIGGLDPLGPGDGMKSGKNTEACANVYTFFFAKIRADQGIRFYYIIVCAACSLYFGGMLIASTLAFWFSAERLLGIAGDRWAHTAHVDTMIRPRYVTGFNTKE